MQWRTVQPIALPAKGDRSRFQIDFTKGYRRLRQAAALPHGSQPAIRHPTVSRGERGFDGCLFVSGDLWFLPWGSAPQSKSHSRIGGDVASPNGLLHYRRKNFELGQCGVVRTRLDQTLRGMGAKGRIVRAQVIRDLRGCDHTAMRKKRADCGPPLLISKQCLLVRILLSKETRNPRIESVALRLFRKRVLMHRRSGDSLLDFATSAISSPANTRRLTAPCAVRLLESNPIKRTAGTNVKRSHECSMV